MKTPAGRRNWEEAGWGRSGMRGGLSCLLQGGPCCSSQHLHLDSDGCGAISEAQQRVSFPPWLRFCLYIDVKQRMQKGWTCGYFPVSSPTWPQSPFVPAPRRSPLPRPISLMRPLPAGLAFAAGQVAILMFTVMTFLTTNKTK